MTVGHVRLDKADNNDNADNARLSITFSCHNDECQTLETNSCSPWYHKTCAECVKPGVMCALCRRNEGFGSNVLMQRREFKCKRTG